MPKFKEIGLDFKNLHNFNLALVAKQGWRILQNETSFLSRVYKAKYFPNVSFFETPLGHYPFYVWCGIWKVRCGIWKARCWLQEGCLYQIGDKNKVRIWKGPWIPNLHFTLDPLMDLQDKPYIKLPRD